MPADANLRQLSPPIPAEPSTAGSGAPRPWDWRAAVDGGVMVSFNTATTVGQRTALSLEQECQLIDNLRQALRRERAGVAADDAEAIEASVHAVSRTLLTIDGARRRRIELVGSLTGTDEVPLAQLERCLRRAVPERLRTAREGLRRGAEAAASDVATNQQVLRRALEAGDAYLQALFASAGDPMSVYSPARGGAVRPGGVLLDRTA